MSMHPVQGNAAQKRWMESVRNLGMGSLIHHCTDRTMQIKFIGNIGHWWIIPLHGDDHHHQVEKMGRDRKPYEKTRFAEVCEVFQELIGPLPLPEGVYDAIMAFHK